jgi:endonuclease-8
MPEGDNLHRIALELGPVLTGKPLRALTLVRSTARIEGLLGNEIVGVEARGKNLLVHFAAGFALHVHLKMNGSVRLERRDDTKRVNTSRAVAVLDTDEHRVLVSDAPVARLIRSRDLKSDAHFRSLGPDLLGPVFDVREGFIRLKLRGKQILGEALLDQSVMAGIGNVWKSELCFTLRLDPFAPVSAHSDQELQELVALARKQMFDNVYGPKRSLPDPFDRAPPTARKARVDPRQGEGVLSVYERSGQACYDCRTTKIEMRRQGEQQRSTYYCPTCQPSRSAT